MSWNIIEVELDWVDEVILFVRMWVEIYPTWHRRISLNRHPLREDVSWNYAIREQIVSTQSHPLREDVSWNTSIRDFIKGVIVILFVRMWVEMLLWSEARLYLHVILFVRMWVEIIFYTDGACSGNRHPLREDVSWNKESKYIDEELRRHPLREDVSWNTWWRTRKPNRRVILFVRMWVEILSSVFWTLQC